MKYIDFYRKSAIIAPIFADMAELADALDLGSNIYRCAGSSPVIRTRYQVQFSVPDFLWIYLFLALLDKLVLLYL